ncbi:hypothetical protein HYS99_01060 [Candidatus Giovannonibacteria bacterium]|nr:hypothetical protein [Candidatus Giovannonibacteria bacterium]
MLETFLQEMEMEIDVFFAEWQTIAEKMARDNQPLNANHNLFERMQIELTERLRENLDRISYRKKS